MIEGKPYGKKEDVHGEMCICENFSVSFVGELTGITRTLSLLATKYASIAAYQKFDTGQKLKPYQLLTDTTYSVDNEVIDDNIPRLVFFWTWVQGDPSTPLPVSMKIEEIEPLIVRWVLESKKPPKPDMDGDIGAGIQISTFITANVAYRWRAAFEVSPAWALYPK